LRLDSGEVPVFFTLPQEAEHLPFDNTSSRTAFASIHVHLFTGRSLFTTLSDISMGILKATDQGWVGTTYSMTEFKADTWERFGER
jgi:hypothetical protein